MKPTPTSTVRDVVTDDFRAAAVFHGYGIDFCCGGKRTIAEACGELNLCPDEVLREVSKACNDKDVAVPRYAEWETDALIRHIVDGHHAYVRRALRSIGEMLEKLMQRRIAGHSSPPKFLHAQTVPCPKWYPSNRGKLRTAQP